MVTFFLCLFGLFIFIFRRDSFSIELMGGSSEDMEDIVDWGGRG